CSVADAVPAATSADGVTPVAGPAPVLVTVIVTANGVARPIGDGIASVAASTAGGLMLTVVVAFGDAAGAPVTASLPVAHPASCSVPAVCAVNVHVNCLEPPAAIAADAGEGPEVIWTVAPP